MGFYFPRVAVQKARPRRPRTNTYKRQAALSTNISNGVRLDLFRGLKKFKSHVDPEQVYQAWKTGHYAKIMDAVPWPKLPELIEPAAKRLQTGVERSATFNLKEMPAVVSDNLKFSMQNPRIRDYVNRRSGSMVVNIQTDAQKVIQNAVARSFNESLNPRDVAGIIRGSIGLYPAQETALYNYRRGLTEKEIDPDRIESLTAAYEDRLLDQRSMTIARTETRLATNIGQQSVWEQAAQGGLIPPESRRVWIVDGNPCEICEPMDGESVGLYEPWILSTGDAVMIPTESHPNCMCGVELDMGYNQESGGNEDIGSDQDSD